MPNSISTLGRTTTPSPRRHEDPSRNPGHRVRYAKYPALSIARCTCGKIGGGSALGLGSPSSCPRSGFAGSSATVGPWERGRAGSGARRRTSTVREASKVKFLRTLRDRCPAPPLRDVRAADAALRDERPTK